MLSMGLLILTTLAKMALDVEKLASLLFVYKWTLNMDMRKRRS